MRSECIDNKTYGNTSAKNFGFQSISPCRSEWEYYHILLWTVGSVCAFKAASWQRIDIAFHSATHSVTRLPFPPQGPLSWELACQPAMVWRWRVRGVRFDWDMEEIEEGEVGERAILRLSAKMRMITLPWHTHKGFSFPHFFKVLTEELLSLGSSEWTFFANGRELEHTMAVFTYLTFASSEPKWWTVKL